MKLTGRIRRGLARLAASIYWFPQAIIKRGVVRRGQSVREVNEAERLDRIRNPHKYRCK